MLKYCHQSTMAQCCKQSAVSNAEQHQHHPSTGVINLRDTCLLHQRFLYTIEALELLAFLTQHAIHSRCTIVLTPPPPPSRGIVAASDM